jgi:hypothetical protein
VQAFKLLFSGTLAIQEVVVKIRSTQLKKGMVLAKDLVTREGLLLLSQDYVLDDALIEQMIKFEHTEKYALTFWVKSQE